MVRYIIKPMETEEEMDGKGFVHWKSWQEAYAGLLDPDYLANGQTLEKCLRAAHRWPDNLLIAKDQDRVIGFASYGAYRDDTLKDCGEVFALYVLKEYYDQGIGYALMNAALEQMKTYSQIALWVLDGNERAIRFYERYGFRFDNTSQSIILGSPVLERRMLYCRPYKRS